MRGFRLGLRRRLLVFYIVLVGLLLAGMGIFIYFQTEDQFITNRTNQAREVVYWAVNSTQPEGQLRADSLESVAERLSTSPSPDFSFFLFDNAGELLERLGQGDPSFTLEALSSSSITKAIKEGREASFIVPAGDRQYRTLVYVFPVVDSQGHLQGVIQTQARLDEADRALHKLRWTLLSGLGGGFLVACALGFVFMKATLRPLENMTDTSRAVASGDLSRRIPLSRGQDELQDTARTFNMMMDSIEQYMAREKQNQERLKQLFADLAHEFRSPLTVLRGYTDVLSRNTDFDRSTLERSLQAMHTTIEQLTRLTNDLLTISRLDAGMGLNPEEEVDIDYLCLQLCQTFQTIAEGKEVVFNAGPTVKVKGDVELLRRVLWNILDNAIRHTKTRGKIVITARSEAGRYILTVQDNGEGIPPEHLPHVFERFYRASHSHPGSTGLGLSIAKSIVEAHGGQISIESAVGEGTTVTMVLPTVQGR